MSGKEPVVGRIPIRGRAERKVATPAFYPGLRIIFSGSWVVFCRSSLSLPIVVFIMEENMMRLVFAMMAAFASAGIAVAGQPADTLRYEVVNNMPVFYQQMKNALTYPLAWDGVRQADFASWRGQARAKVVECLQNVQPAPDAYVMQTVAVEQREGYEARKIEFNISAWSRVSGYLLVPQGYGGKRLPAIVMLHDHGAHFSIGKEKMVRPFEVSAEVLADADDWAVRCYDGQYVGDYFARHGFVVLCVDALFWGERGCKEGIDYDRQQALASNFLQMGSSWGAYINMDDVRSAEFLASLPFVDPERVGCLGFSMGAYRSWMLSALTDVVKVSASVCWMNTTEHLMTLTNNQNKGGSAYSMIVPGLRRWLDYPHVASIACPKPTLFFNGSRDKLFPVSGVKDAYGTMRRVWGDNGASDRLVTKLWDEQHFFNRDMQREVLEFFQKWL